MNPPTLLLAYDNREWLLRLWLDRLWGMTLFGIVLVGAYLLFHFLLRRSTVRGVDRALARLPHAASLRHCIAIALLVLIAIYTGAPIRRAGYSAFIVALLAAAIAAFIVGIVAPRLTVGYGVAAASLVIVSVVFCSLHEEGFAVPRPYSSWASYAREAAVPLLIFWSLSAAIGVAVCVPLRRVRQKT
jgi:hypothetical protein